jgi:hypothetical protein
MFGCSVEHCCCVRLNCKHGCKDDVSLTDVSLNENCWILRILYYLSLVLIIPDPICPDP